jgi:hypothetical protein
VAALPLHLTGWGSFGRSARDSLIMNLAAIIPVCAVLIVMMGVFYYDRGTRAPVIVLGAGWIISVLVKTWMLSKVKPTPLSRPAAGALAADLVSWGLMIGGAFLLIRGR